MEDYDILETIGQGSYGVVLRAIHLPTGGQVYFDSTYTILTFVTGCDKKIE